MCEPSQPFTAVQEPLRGDPCRTARARADNAPCEFRRNLRDYEDFRESDGREKVPCESARTPLDSLPAIEPDRDQGE